MGQIEYFYSHFQIFPSLQSFPDLGFQFLRPEFLVPANPIFPVYLVRDILLRLAIISAYGVRCG